MTRETKNTIQDLTARLWGQPLREYLVSEDFARFCRERDLSDEWSRSLGLSGDKPDLYGDSVERDAFFQFLNHLYHHRVNEFLFLFSHLLADYSRGLSCDLPVDDIRSFLLLLGYPAERIDPALFVLRIKQVPDPDTPADCCRARDNSSGTGE